MATLKTLKNQIKILEDANKALAFDNELLRKKIDIVKTIEADAIRSETPNHVSSLDVQEGGSHYKDFPIQPVQYNYYNNLPHIEGEVVKYVSRWRKKGGLEDLRKAIHFLQMLIDMEEGHGSALVKGQPRFHGPVGKAEKNK